MAKNFSQIGRELADNWNYTNASDADIGRLNASEKTMCLLAAAVIELQKLNQLLGCENFRNIPAILRLIRANTAKPKKRRTNRV